jgi:hypothetical protein
MTEGIAARNIFKKIKKEELALITKASKVCVIFEAPTEYRYAIIFDLIPSAFVADYRSSGLTRQIKKEFLNDCNGLLVYCSSSDDCKEIKENLPELFSNEDIIANFISYKNISATKISK